MKLETGCAKSRDLLFRCENYLGILQRVFNVVLLQNTAGEDTMGWAGRNPAIAFIPGEAGEAQNSCLSEATFHLKAGDPSVRAGPALSSRLRMTAPQMVGSTRGGCGRTAEGARTFILHRNTASAETIARAIQMRRKV